MAKTSEALSFAIDRQKQLIDKCYGLPPIQALVFRGARLDWARIDHVCLSHGVLCLHLIDHTNMSHAVFLGQDFAVADCVSDIEIRSSDFCMCSNSVIYRSIINTNPIRTLGVVNYLLALKERLSCVVRP